MNVLGTPQGIVVIFDSVVELKGVIEHLSGMIEWIETENVPPPYLYSMSDDKIDTPQIEDMLDRLKKGWLKGK